MQHDFILLDRSGSMNDSGKWTEALNAINGYVAKLAADKVDTGVTLAIFDKDGEALSFDIIRDRIIPSTWKPVSDEDAFPRGMTPLNDAIGRLVNLARNGAPGGVQYDKVAIIVVTDGLENASSELSHAGAKAMLDDCRSKGWQVIFLGANFDNAQQAAGLGNAANQSANVGLGKMHLAMEATATLRSAYGKRGASMTYSAEDKARFAK